MFCSSLAGLPLISYYRRVNHVVLFTYVVLITAGTGGVVALSLLHYRLRTGITVGFLVSNSGLLASLLLSLVTHYLDAVVVSAAQEQLFAFSIARTVMGFGLGVVVYGGVVAAILRLPRIPKPLILVLFATVILAMLVQTILIVTGETSMARRLAPAYMYVVSTCLLGIAVIVVRHGGGAETPTMAWFLVRFGYLTAIFAVFSAVVYSLLYYVPGFHSVSFSLDFLYYLLWSALSVGAFVRYLSRPSALLDNDEISSSFVTAFRITPREREIVSLIGQGLSNQQIADRLHVPFATVRTHVYNIFQKTGAGSRVDLLRLVSGYRE